MRPTDRVILLIDMDCFYCQVEEKLNSNLAGKPIAVVQYNAWQGGGIIAVNYPARDRGVTRHMRGFEAKKKCPEITLAQVPELRGKADLTRYRDAGKKVADVLATFTPLLERASVDEAYMDITEAVTTRIQSGFTNLKPENLENTFIVGSSTQDFLANVHSKLAVGALICEEIRLEVFRKTGYKCSAGIAHNKILAKLVCSLHKPNKQTVLPQEAVQEFFQSMPINKITSLGGKFGQNLTEELKITYLGELARFSERELQQKYDEKNGSWLYNIARGVNYDPVTTKLISKSIGCSKNFPGKSALFKSEDIQHWLSELSEDLSERLTKDMEENTRKAKQMTVVFSQMIDKKIVSGTRTQPLSSYDSKKIAQTAFDVIKKNCMKSDGSFHVTHLGFSGGNFENMKNVQTIASFFKHSSEKKSPEEAAPSTSYAQSEDYSSDSDIFNEDTVELEDNLSGLEFFDDRNHAQKDTEPSSKPKEIEKENSSTNTDSAPSFFKNYFESKPVASLIETSSPLRTQQNQNFQDPEVEIKQCPECKKNVLEEDFQAHLDHHFCMKLVQDEREARRMGRQSQKPEEKSSTKKGAGRKRKLQKTPPGNSEVLFSFLKKDDTFENEIVEVCGECNKRVKLDEFQSHLDYHIAKKLHSEINHANPQKTTPKQVTTRAGRTKKNPGKTPQKGALMNFLKPLT